MPAPKAIALCETPVIFEAFRTKLGYVAIAGRAGLLTGVSIGHGAAHEAILAISQSLRSTESWGELRDGKWNRALRDRLVAYALGEKDDFLDVEINTSHLSMFQQQVVEQCRRVSYGQTCSYGQLAANAGSPRAARAVGNIMAGNRYPLIVPCHRIVASTGIGGFSAPRGRSLKHDLLELERTVIANFTQRSSGQ